MPLEDVIFISIVWLTLKEEPLLGELIKIEFGISSLLFLVKILFFELDL